MAFHPATLLSGWVLLALLMQQLAIAGLAALCVVILPLAFLISRRRAWNLLRRARWLLVSIILLFAFATPGRPLVAGLTAEGLALAADHGIRLVLLLASLAIVHEVLGNLGLLAGLHQLLAPLGKWRNLRPRIVTRLLLVLEYVENGPGPGGWRAWLAEPPAGGIEKLYLPAYRVGAADWGAAAILLAAVLVWGLCR